MKTLLRYVLLPAEISAFEHRYLQRMNRIALVFFALHVPVLALVAWCNGLNAWLAAIETAAVVMGPAIALATLRSPRAVSVTHGVAAMFMGGLLVHFGQGPVQIEMHFYFFALVAMCAAFGNPMVIVAAAVTVALHHLVVWLVLPRSVFNYEAAWWVVAVHAAFVVLESVAACFIARSFFDNVIGLEKIVQARTDALDAKNRDMRLLLDNVGQGFLTIDRAGTLATERSRAIDEWFGPPAEGASWFDYLASISPAFAERTRPAWSEVVDDIMPIELTLDQMPHRFAVNGTHYRVDYRPIGAEPHARFLVIVTDVTTDVERETSEIERREAMSVFERVLVDRSGFETFVEEAGGLVEALRTPSSTSPAHTKRTLHTLKGNAAAFGLTSISDACHALEDFMAEEGQPPGAAQLEPLFSRWSRLTGDMEKLLGQRSKHIEISEEQLSSLESALRSGESSATFLKRLQRLRLEPTAKRLKAIAEQAKRIAERLEKNEVEVHVEDHDVRLDAARWGRFWASFMHAVRNAVDHGLETPEERITNGKRPGGSIVLRTVETASAVVVEIVDDGRGIDWDAVAQKAASRGLPVATREDLQRALFVDGMSTAAQVTDVSGRGVGMGALLHSVEQLGGDLRIETRPGAGTTLRMTVPHPPKSPRNSLAPAA